MFNQDILNFRGKDYYKNVEIIISPLSANLDPRGSFFSLFHLKTTTFMFDIKNPEVWIEVVLSLLKLVKLL